MKIDNPSTLNPNPKPNPNPNPKGKAKHKLWTNIVVENVSKQIHWLKSKLNFK